MGTIFSFEATGDLAEFLDRLKHLGQGARSEFIRKAVEEKLAKESKLWKGRISKAIRDLQASDEK
ncbi:MAG: hypothetical protein V3W19_14975 [Desulfatiglandales bacterium]